MHRRVRAQHVVVGQHVGKAEFLDPLGPGAYRADIPAYSVCGKTTPIRMPPPGPEDYPSGRG